MTRVESYPSQAFIVSPYLFSEPEAQTNPRNEKEAREDRLCSSHFLWLMIELIGHSSPVRANTLLRNGLDSLTDA